MCLIFDFLLSPPVSVRLCAGVRRGEKGTNTDEKMMHSERNSDLFVSAPKCPRDLLEFLRELYYFYL